MHFVAPLYPAAPKTLHFIQHLKKKGFQGETSYLDMHLLTAAYDNSVYSQVPKLVIFPKTEQDVEMVAATLYSSEFERFSLTPRGGSTSTNGQSLTPNLVLDFSKFMHSLKLINYQAGYAVVEPGLALGRLNEELEKEGYFFAPNVSTANRATLGGMMATDASGKGSYIYGKTGDHILGCRMVDSQGKSHQIEPIRQQDLPSLEDQDPYLFKLYHKLLDLWQSRQEALHDFWPNLPRYFSGYNIKGFFDPSTGLCDFTRILSGAEGTLGIVTELKLKITKKMPYSRVFVLGYPDFLTALGHAKDLKNQRAAAIETMDEKVLEVSKDDPSFQALESFIPDLNKAQALNFVELLAENEPELVQQSTNFEKFCQTQQKKKSQSFTWYQASTKKEINALWRYRSRSVGILGSVAGKKKPIAFVEDCCVPPENLKSFVTDFQKLLQNLSYQYAMFGHLDSGVIHIRPLMDLALPKDRADFRLISDQVQRLVYDYQGILWGEHGKGFRGEYLEQTLGSTFYLDMRQIKTWLDPKNRLNAGKLYTPLDSAFGVIPLDEVLLKEEQNPTPDEQHPFYGSYLCNGNGECLSSVRSDLMCPSYKLHKDQIHSPKGRSILLKTWVQALEQENPDFSWHTPRTKFWKQAVPKSRTEEETNFSLQLKKSLDGCLSCKACSHICPVRVDIPDFRAKFYDQFYAHYQRPAHDRLLFKMEKKLPLAFQFRWLGNFLLRRAWFQNLVTWRYQLVDLPLFAKLSLKRLIQQTGGPYKTVRALPKNLERGLEKPGVILLADSFLYYFEPEVLQQTYQFLTLAGYDVYLAPATPNGKAYHVKGFLTEFVATAEKQQKRFSKLSQFSLPIVAVEPSIALLYREEYQAYLAAFKSPVLLLHEFLKSEQKRHDSPLAALLSFRKEAASAFSGQPSNTAEEPAVLFTHCSEKSALPAVADDWKALLESFGLRCVQKNTGCCGMAGVYGHEQEHQADSKAIFKQSWHEPLQEAGKAPLLVTGFSCREQVRRCSGLNPQHPIALLNQTLLHQTQPRPAANA